MKYIFAICFSLFSSTVLLGQSSKEVTTTIHGTIAGFDTKKPIANAIATLSGNGITKKVNTDAKGGFSFGQLQAGKYDVSYEATGYQTQVRKQLPLAAGKRIRTAVLLKRN